MKKEIKVKVDSKLKAPRKLPRNIGIYLLVMALVVAVFIGLNQVNQPAGSSKDLSTVISEIRNGQVDKVVVSGNDVTVTLKDGSVQSTKKEPQESFTQTLQAAGIKAH